MPQRKTVKLPPPTDFEEFEKLLRDLFARLWNNPGTQRNGRSGQGQHGVDIFGRPNDGKATWGVQAKATPGGVTSAVLRKEVEEAKAFVPKLENFILATTAPSDESIQEVARELTAQHQPLGLFSVEVWSWDAILNELVEHGDLLQLYYSEFIDAPPNSEASVERNRPTFECIYQSHAALSSKFTPEYKIRQATGDYVPRLKWRYCGPLFLMEWRSASGPSLDRTSVSEVFNLTTAPTKHRNVEETEMGLEIRFSWRGKFRREIHRWPLSRRNVPQKVLYDLGPEALELLQFDDDEN